MQRDVLEPVRCSASLCTALPTCISLLCQLRKTLLTTLATIPESDNIKVHTYLHSATWRAAVVLHPWGCFPEHLEDGAGKKHPLVMTVHLIDRQSRNAWWDVLPGQVTRLLGMVGQACLGPQHVAGRMLALCISRM